MNQAGGASSVALRSLKLKPTTPNTPSKPRLNPYAIQHGSRFIPNRQPSALSPISFDRHAQQAGLSSSTRLRCPYHAPPLLHILLQGRIIAGQLKPCFGLPVCSKYAHVDFQPMLTLEAVHQFLQHALTFARIARREFELDGVSVGVNRIAPSFHAQRLARIQSVAGPGHHLAQIRRRIQQSTQIVSRPGLPRVGTGHARRVAHEPRCEVLFKTDGHPHGHWFPRGPGRPHQTDRGQQAGNDDPAFSVHNGDPLISSDHTARFLRGSSIHLPFPY